MRLDLSHLVAHKFRHSFQDCLKPIGSCGQDIETLSHFPLIPNNSSIAGMFSYKLTFSFVVIFLLSTFSLVYCFICHLGTMWSSVNSFSLYILVFFLFLQSTYVSLFNVHLSNLQIIKFTCLLQNNLQRSYLC